MTSITKIQRGVLEAAARRNDLTAWPIRGSKLNIGSATRTIKELIRKGLVVEKPAIAKAPVWREDDAGQSIMAIISDDSLAAIGMLPAGKAGRRSRAAGKNVGVAAQQGVVAGVSGDGPPAPRPNSKLALLVELLTREQGATLDELAKATVWQHHTVRGTLAGAMTKRFGFVIRSDKTSERGRSIGPHADNAQAVAPRARVGKAELTARPTRRRRGRHSLVAAAQSLAAHGSAVQLATGDEESPVIAPTCMQFGAAVAIRSFVECRFRGRKRNARFQDDWARKRTFVSALRVGRIAARVTSAAGAMLSGGRRVVPGSAPVARSA